MHAQAMIFTILLIPLNLIRHYPIRCLNMLVMVKET